MNLHITNNVSQNKKSMHDCTIHVPSFCHTFINWHCFFFSRLVCITWWTNKSIDLDDDIIKEFHWYCNAKALITVYLTSGRFSSIRRPLLMSVSCSFCSPSILFSWSFFMLSSFFRADFSWKKWCSWLNIRKNKSKT